MNNTHNLFKFLIHLYSKQKYKLGLLFLMSISLSLYGLFAPLILKYVVDNITMENFLLLAERYSPILIIIIIMQLMVKYCYSILNNNIVVNSNLFLRKQINATLKTSSYDSFSNLKNKNLIQIITYDVPQCQGILNSIFFEFSIQILVFVSTLLIIINLNVKLTLIILMFLPIYYIVFSFFNKRLHRINIELIENRDFLSNTIEKIKVNFKGYKLYSRHNDFDNQYNKGINKLSVQQTKNVKLAAYMNIVMSMLFFCLIGTVIVIGISEIKNGSLSIGALSAFLMYAFNFFSPIQKIMDLFVSYRISMLSIKRVYELLSTDRELVLGRETDKIINGTISFKSASIKIGNKEIVKNINGEIRRGRINYLVGKNATGKTTLILSLIGFYQSKGIKLDKIDIQKYKLDILRSNTSVVFQNPEFITDDVLTQLKIIELYNKNKTIKSEKKELVDQCVKELSNLLDFTKPILQLSGGKKQLLSIISSLKTYPEILILDESFSNLDSEVRFELKQVVDILKNHITIIIIDHFVEPSPHDNIVNLNSQNSFIQEEIT